MDIEKSKEPHEYLELERQGWPAAMAGYKDTFAVVTRQTVGPMLDAAGVRSGMRVVDVCCGPGMLAGAAADRGAKAVGVDFAGVVDVARTVAPNATFEAGDAMALPFADNSVDAVLCGYGVFHVPDPERAMTEMLRVLKPGGRAALSVWDVETPNNGLGLIFRAIQEHGNVNVALPHGPSIFQFSTPAKLTAAMQSVGFANVTIDYVPQHWRLPSAQSLIDAAKEGTVRAKTMLDAQTPQQIAAIAGSLDRSLHATRDGGALVVPMPALVGSGAKP